MHPTSDPKTSPNNSAIAEVVAFQDRLYVAGNASFLCLIIAIGWAFFFVGKVSFTNEVLLMLAPPLVATGSTVLITGFSRYMVPKPNLSAPLNLSIPAVWCLVCYLAILLISTQETSTGRVPEQLIPALNWSKVALLLPVWLSQTAILTMFVMLSRHKESA